MGGETIKYWDFRNTKSSGAYFYEYYRDYPIYVWDLRGTVSKSFPDTKLWLSIVLIYLGPSYRKRHMKPWCWG